MNLSAPLFNGDLVRLMPIDHEKDVEAVVAWSHNGEFGRMFALEPVRPLTVDQVKKQFEDIDKAMDENKNLFHFHIHPREADRLIGLARLEWVEWSLGNAWVKMGIADPADRRKGYGSETLRMLVRFAFMEVNLYRLSVIIPGYNEPALNFFEKAGFVRETCRRQAVNRGGRRWDLIGLGLLRPEWEARHGSA